MRSSTQSFEPEHIVPSMSELLMDLAGSTLGALVLFYIVFLPSRARTRVDGVADATRQIIRKKESGSYTGALTNQFRSSLGVMLDRLVNCYGTDQQFAENGPWPCLCDFNESVSKGKLEQVDRWKRFNECVQPVSMEIDAHSVLRWFSLTPTLWRLNALIDLCRALEAVVSKFDSACGQGLVDLDKNDEVVMLNSDNPDLNPLREDYRKLHTAWIRWRQMSSLALLTNYVL